MGKVRVVLSINDEPFDHFERDVESGPRFMVVGGWWRDTMNEFDDRLAKGITVKDSAPNPNPNPNPNRPGHGDRKMSDGKKDFDEDCTEYEELCKLYRENLRYIKNRDGIWLLDSVGPHAEILRKRHVELSLNLRWETRADGVHILGIQLRARDQHYIFTFAGATEREKFAQDLILLLRQKVKP